jgi:hypothetical protein
MADVCEFMTDENRLEAYHKIRGNMENQVCYHDVTPPYSGERG